ncbi:YIP1 family protein [Desulfococcus sp.]|uniref:YIP1 family protein n=1 Tax=Desulfococcus sp. TaxID=2025834 RepID=UPI0035932FB4
MATPRFSVRFYFRTLSQLLANPKGFFTELPSDMGMATPFCFLMVSSIIFTLASLMNAAVGPLVAVAIFMANAVGMVFITSGLGFMVTVLALGRKDGYGRFFAVYAFSAGVTLLSSWMPYFLFIAEPWKWWLIYTGLTRNLALKWQQALMVIGLSITILILFFYSMLPFFSRA